MKDIIYLKIYNQIKEDILGGICRPGDKLMGIRELALHYGASHKTVSRALECLVEDGFVRATQGQGIFVLEKSRWKQQASSSGQLGLVINDMTIPFNVKFSSILERRATELGYRLIVRATGYDPEKQKAGITDLLAGGIEGLIIVPSPSKEMPLAQTEVVNRPIIYAGEFSPPADFSGHYIVVDSYGGFYHAASTLAEAGNESVGYIGAGADRENEPGYQACRDALSARRRAFNEAFFVSAGGYDAEHGVRAMRELLLSGEYPTGVVCFSDTLAAGAMKACREEGIRVPDDISIIGAGDQDIASLVDPPLTTLKTPAELMGLLTIDLLDDLIHQRLRSPDTVRVRLDMELIHRCTVARTEETDIRWV